jgi:protein SCO1/2
MQRLRIAAALLVVGLSAPVAATEDARKETALQVSRDAIGNSVPDLAFSDAGRGRIALGDLRGKPVVVTLVYTSCADICPVIIESLAAAVDIAEETLGKGSFNVLTVGFDTRNDSPQRMRSFARAHGAGGDNWLFVAADRQSVERLAAATGFSYFASAGGFDHMAQVTVLDGSGNVYQQIYGDVFEPPALVAPLRQLILGGTRSVFSLAGLGDRLRLFCQVYDRNSGRYRVDYSLLASIFAGAVSLLAVLAFFVRELRKSRQAGGA